MTTKTEHQILTEAMLQFAGVVSQPVSQPITESETLNESGAATLKKIEALGFKRKKLEGTNTRANAAWENDDFDLEYGHGSVGGTTSKWRVFHKRDTGSDAARFSDTFKGIHDFVTGYNTRLKPR